MEEKLKKEKLELEESFKQGNEYLKHLSSEIERTTANLNAVNGALQLIEKLMKGEDAGV